MRQRGPWRDVDAVEYETLRWVDWFNTRRLLEPIRNLPPVGFENAFYDHSSPQTAAS
jgi:transposase InsO family protein